MADVNEMFNNITKEQQEEQLDPLSEEDKQLKDLWNVLFRAKPK